MDYGNLVRRITDNTGEIHSLTLRVVALEYRNEVLENEVANLRYALENLIDKLNGAEEEPYRESILVE